MAVAQLFIPRPCLPLASMDSYCWRASSIYLFIQASIHSCELHHPRGAPHVSIYLFIRPLPSGPTFHCPAGGDRTYSYAGRRLPTPRGTISSGRSIYSYAHRYIPNPIARLNARVHPFIHTRSACSLRIPSELPWLVSRITMTCQDFFGMTMNSLQNYNDLSGFLRNHHEQSPESQ